MDQTRTLFNVRLTRRRVLRAATAVTGTSLLFSPFSRAAWAQDASPAAVSDLASLGLPTIDLTATDSAFEGAPSELPAGRYLVTLTNTTAVVSGAEFLQLPEGMSAEDFKGLFLPPSGSPEAEPAAASPESASEEDSGPPPWYYDVYQAGGPAANPGQTVRGIVELRPGDYVVWGDDPAAPQVPTALTVTGEMPTSAAEPPAAVTIREHHEGDGFAFTVEGSFTAGVTLVKVFNESEQPHFVLFLQSPVDLTEEQLPELIELAATEGTPTADSGLPDPQSLPQAAFISTQSGGSTQWMEVELDSGTYVILCFIGDPTKGGVPHVFEGMAALVRVP